MNFHEAVADFKRMFISSALQRNLSVSATARELGLNRTDLYKRMQQLGITPPKIGSGRRGNELWKELGR